MLILKVSRGTKMTEENKNANLQSQQESKNTNLLLELFETHLMSSTAVI